MSGRFVSWADLLRLPVSVLEGSLRGMETGIKTMQTVMRTATGSSQPPLPKAAPIRGPENMDVATSDLANRFLRMLQSSAYRSERPADLARMVAGASRELLLGSKGPGNLILLPFATGTLATQEMLRGLAFLQAVRPEIWREFFPFVVEIFGDLPIFFSLQYGEVLADLRRELILDPENSQARYDLGHLYIKCGLYPEAITELQNAARDPALRNKANYECLLAAYRAADYGRAVSFGEACLAEAPEHDRARYWLWLTSRKCGGYAKSIPTTYRMEAVAGYHPSKLQLEDVANKIGLDKTCGGRGTAIFDATGNGYLDVVIAGAHAGCSLYRNNGDGTFHDISIGSGLDKCVYAFSVAAGDYNNDGLVDLFISGMGFFDGQGLLLRNNGDGTFSDVTKEAGLNIWGPGFTATWVDYDLDGHLDLFVVNNLGGLFDRKTPNRLFHNNGDGTFREVTEEAGLNTPWPSLGAAWGDFNNNGYPDLFVSNMGRSQLFRNKGDGTFKDVSKQAGVESPGLGSSALCCDIDNDGWLDIVQFNYAPIQDAIYSLRHGKAPRGGNPPRVYRNNRDGSFTDIGPRMGLTQCFGTMSGNAGDVTNNGHMDLLLGNGDPSMDRMEASTLLENNGQGRFNNVSFAAGLPFTGKGHGVNMADLAGDGRLHLMVAAGGLYPGDLMRTTVFRPKTLPGHYLNIRLVGTSCNRDALGARITLSCDLGKQHRLVSPGSGFGCLPTEQHFGLGPTGRANRLEIRWPGGNTQHLEDLPTNDTIRITQGTNGWEKVYR